MKLFRSTVLGLFLGCLALPSLADAPFTVDSPSLLEAHRQFILVNYKSSSGGGKETELVPGLTYKYGLNRNFEFKFDTNISTVHKAGKVREAGLGDTSLQLKWRFLDESKTRPGIALGYKLKLPTADADRGLGSGVTDNFVWLTIGKSFGRYRLYGNVGYNTLGASGAKDNAYYGMVLNYKVTEKLNVGAEFYGNGAKANNAKDELAWSVGATYRYAPDHTFYLGVGKSEHGFSNLNVYAGVGFTFK